jgi:FMN phosphatase YigB (HAD superfamily)
MIRLLVFDWGDTIMRDFNLPGPMSHWPEVEWIDGAQKALLHLHNHYCCAIATSADHSDVPEMKAALARVGADVYFHKFYSQKELGFRKPDVRFFLEVIRLSGYQADESVMIGNLYDKDIVGARKAGMKTVLLSNDGDASSFPDADFLIRNMNELCELF